MNLIKKISQNIFWERRESNPGLLSEKRECYLPISRLILCAGDDLDRRREGQRRGFHAALRENRPGRLGAGRHRVPQAHVVSHPSLKTLSKVL